MRPHAVTLGLTAIATFCMAIPSAWSDDWQSAAATEALIRHLEATNADAIAVRDPEHPDRFIAALKLPGQLLVVSASHPAADLLQGRLDRGEYRQIYMDLQATPAQASKFFIHDLDADGLGLSGRGEAFDMVYDGASTLACDGRWKDAKMKEDDYRTRVSEADARYARMLGLLSSGAPATHASR